MKKIMVRTGSYTDKQGNEKGNFVNVGLIGTTQQGKEYVLLDPSVNLAGLLMIQRIQNAKAGYKPKGDGDRLMCSVFDNNNGGNNQSSRQNNNNQNQSGGPPTTDHDDDIPF